MGRDCITWKCDNNQVETNAIFCEDCLQRMEAKAVRRNERRKEIAKDKECVYCGESGDSDDKGNLVAVPQEHWVPWAHQGCIEFERDD